MKRKKNLKMYQIKKICEIALNRDQSISLMNASDKTQGGFHKIRRMVNTRSSINFHIGDSWSLTVPLVNLDAHSCYLKLSMGWISRATRSSQLFDVKDHQKLASEFEY